MATFGDLAGELVGRVPGLSPILAETFIQRAFRDVCKAKLWSWLLQDGVVNCPAMVTAGTAAFVQYTTTVTMSAAATTALNAITAPALTALQFRPQGASTVSQIYNIVNAVGNPLVLTLDRAIQEPTNALSPYQVYRVYVLPPVSDFLTWVSFDDFANAIRITDKKLRFTSAYFDVRDPQRQAQGLAYYLGFYKAATANFATDPSTNQPYELWPGSTQGQQWYVRFRRRGATVAMTDTVPDSLNTALVTTKALGEYVYPHAAANAGHFPAMAKVNWRLLMEGAKAKYIDDLFREKINDDEIATQNILNWGHGLRSGVSVASGFDGPIDSNYIQSHPITW